MPKLLIDSDILLYRSACTNEQTIKWSDDLESFIVDLEQAKEDSSSFIKKLLKDTSADEAILCFSCQKEENFRYKVLPTYKHNRKDRPKPTLYYDLKDWLKENYDCKEKPQLEADDVLGILATLAKDPYECIIASLDKDLNQIPGLHYNWNHKDLYEVTQEEADFFFYMQILTGDSTDGYSGCPGIGKKKAEKILTMVPPEPTYYWSEIVDAYESKDLTKEDALQQARAARILRKEDYDFKRKEVILWKPLF